MAAPARLSGAAAADLQVEYTSSPPGLSTRAPRMAIIAWSACSPAPPEVSHFRQICGCFRNVPSPEHGTSHKTRSSLKSSAANAAAAAVAGSAPI